MEWFIDGGYPWIEDARAMADFYLREGAESAHIVQHPSWGSWWIAYLRTLPLFDSHDRDRDRWLVARAMRTPEFQRGRRSGEACNECGRRLTDPLSVAAGHGPTCSRRVLADA